MIGTRTRVVIPKQFSFVVLLIMIGVFGFIGQVSGVQVIRLAGWLAPSDRLIYVSRLDSSGNGVAARNGWSECHGHVPTGKSPLIDYPTC